MPYTIEIDGTKCNGCGKCTEACDHMVLEIKQANNKSRMANKYNPNACAFCLNCLVSCPREAIYIADDRGTDHTLQKAQ